MTKTFPKVFSVIIILALMLAGMPMQSAGADNTAQSLPFSQDWTNTGLISANDDWSGVSGIIGYLGDDPSTTTSGIDPQTVLIPFVTQDVIANQTAPNTLTNGGVAEFHIADPTVALNGSGTADAPHIILHLNSTGQSNITVSYNLRDLDGSIDNAIQPIALQYRVGSSGNFTNVPAGFVADATTGPSLATLVTSVSAVLPSDANNQSEVQVRIITWNAVGNDEWVGIDDMNVTGTAGDTAPMVSSNVPDDGAVDVAVDSNIIINFSENVDVAGTWFDISCTINHTAVVSGGPLSFTLDPDIDFAEGELCTVTVFAAQVTDQDADDPPDVMEEDYVFSFTTFSPPPPSPMIINELDSDTPGTDVAEFVELYDGGLGNTDLSGLVVVLYNGDAGDTSYARFDLDGFSTNASGYFVLGNSGVTPDLTFANGTLQNGADAAALYRGDAADFPNGTAVTTLDLIDAVVYETADADDPGLLPLLNAGQPQVDENAGGNGADHSSQRCPNGSGGQRHTDTYIQNAPSPGATNNCGVAVTIMQIQDSAHLSPYAGQLVVDVPGIVTAVASNGFFMQDSVGDASAVTSDGIFVFTNSAPSVTVGDSLLVRGFVSEFRPGGNSTGNLTTTELVGPFLSVTPVSSGNALPPATVIGIGGRVPPTAVINDDGTGNVETSGTFDATTDGIDFYESMEGMRVQVNNPVAVGPSNDFGEIFVLADDGANAGVRTARGGINIQPGDFNPERIQLDDGLASTPDANVGDHFNEGFAVGVLDYNFGNFEIRITSPLTVDPGGLAREVTGDPTDHQLSVASFNVENLGGNEAQAKFDTLAGLIVQNLKSPDIIGLEEIQDNNGTTDDGTVDATLTLDRLVDAIVDAGGPEYQFRQIDPEDGEDGGAPGGNIRVGFLFNPDRVSFVDRPGGTSTDPVDVVSGGSGPELSFSPGRIDPTNVAFDNSRKPLAGEFLFEGDKVFVVVNHFNSKGGDDPLFGRFQPPVLSSEVQRLLQAQVVNDFVDDVLALDSDANVIVLGDLNDFQFSAPLSVLKGGVLVDLVEDLPLEEQYTYVFEGNSQALDHILASNRLADAPLSYDIVHVNSEFHDQTSDHEPEVALMCVDRTDPELAVTVSLDSLWPPNHKYVDVNASVSVSDNADSSVTFSLVSVTSNEPDDAPGPADGNTKNDIVIVDADTFRLRAERSNVGTGRIYTITYQATDACGNSTTESATVTVPIIQ